jgi:DMSO/TMAO reductase YedYZ molybdopterin-dependent catalytic subunit
MDSHEAAYLATRSEQLASRTGLSRRDVLKLGAALSVAAGVAQVAPAGAARAATLPPGSPIVKPLPPEWFVNFGTNAEMRWDAVQPLGYKIPNERFFVRDHTATPLIDVRTWQLRVFGSGLAGPGKTFTYDQLRRLPHREVVAFIECAGNGRSLFASQQNTPAPGTQWGLGAIGVAHWRGVPLVEVLKRAGLSRRAVDVMPSGLDPNVVTGGVAFGHVRRPIPIEKALDDALLVLEMNGKPLPPDHGFPVRLLVPGWVGIANIKWVGQIEVSDQPLFSFWNTQQYVLTGDAYPDQPVLTTQTVKTAWELARGAELPANTPVQLIGRAWSGTSAIRQVEVSIDQGTTWTPARLHGRNLPGAWTRFRYTLPPRPAGNLELWARATDDHGSTQPQAVPFNTFGYLFGAVVRHPVTLVDLDGSRRTGARTPLVAA